MVGKFTTFVLICKRRSWTPEFHEELRAWWVKFEEYIVSKYAAGERKMTNNHGSWYDPPPPPPALPLCIAMLSGWWARLLSPLNLMYLYIVRFDVDWQSVALFVGNLTAASEAGQEVCTQRIAKQISPNGEEWIELERAVPSGYCQYNLEALVQDADLAASLPGLFLPFALLAIVQPCCWPKVHQTILVWLVASAVDVWGFTTSDGRSLMKSIEWLTPYATGACRIGSRA